MIEKYEYNSEMTLVNTEDLNRLENLAEKQQKSEGKSDLNEIALDYRKQYKKKHGCYPEDLRLIRMLLSDLNDRIYILEDKLSE